MTRSVRVAIAALFVILPHAVFAGGRAFTPPVPTLGEAGMAAFAVSLLGGGVVLLRRRKR